MSQLNVGLAALRGSNNILNSTVKGLTDQGGLAELAYDIRSMENKATKLANQEAQNKLLLNKLANKKIDIQKDIDKYVEKKYKPVARMAGVLAATEGIASASLMHAANERLKKQQEVLRGDREKLMEFTRTLRGREDQRQGSEIEFLEKRLKELQESIKQGGKPVSTQKSTTTEKQSTPAVGASSTLSGVNKQIADYVAGGESGSLGYDAMNQGTDASGNIVNPGSFAQILGGGTPLTSMTLEEVIKKQSGYDDKTISDSEWRKRGGLHAAGRYQFIGPTLKEEVRLMGLPLDTVFSPDVQDKIFLSHVKRTGSFQPWEGVNKRSDRYEMEKLIPQITL